jgi:hypothetical protein
MWEAFRTAAAGMQSHPDFGLAESRVLARREAHVAGEDELAAHAPDTASDLRDADHRGLGETHERIYQDREARSPDSSHDVPYLAGQIKVGKTRGKALEVPLTELQKTETEMALNAVVNKKRAARKHSAQDLISTPALKSTKGSSARKSYRRLPHARAA